MSKLNNINADKSITPNLEEILIGRKLIRGKTYRKAQRLSKRQGLDIRQYLYKSGLVPHLEMQQALAVSRGGKINFVQGSNHEAVLINQKICAENGYNLIDNYGGLNAITPLVETNEHADSGFDENINLAPISNDFLTARDFRSLFIGHNKDKLSDQASNLLGDKSPKLTAKSGMYLTQKLVVFSLIMLVALLLLNNLILGLYYVSIGFSCIFLFASSIKIYSLFLPKATGQNPPDDYLKLDHAQLPIYSILVPLFKEASLVKQLTDNILKLNYPKSKLDIKLIFEEQDLATISAAKQLKLPECFEFIYVPPTKGLQTKPRAMNFALPFVLGEYLTIYDAEDVPEPDQLLKAIDKFQQEDESLACLQASLEYENWDENWLARHFFIEYATQFNRFLPALERLGIPLPLGGTSNHFKTKILREIGGWDAYNVTEDADIGIRLALFGYRSGTLNSVTLEEANYKLFPWFAQRRRWLKGWFQTIIVHSRHPLTLYKSIGLFKFLGLLTLMCGVVFSSLLHPIIFILPVWLYFTLDFDIIFSSNLNIILFSVSFMALVIGYGAALISNFQAVAAFKRWRLLPILISAPIYWLLISISAWLAVRDYIRDPFFWAKTEHGVSAYLNNKNAQKLLADKEANKLK